MEQHDPNAPQTETKDDDSPVAAVDCPSKLALTNYQLVSTLSAAKIVGMEMTTTGASLTLEGNDAPLAVDSVFIADHKPCNDSYLVVDDDGMSVVGADFMEGWKAESQDGQPELGNASGGESTGQSGTSENQPTEKQGNALADANPNASDPANAGTTDSPVTGTDGAAGSDDNTPDPAADVDGDGNPNPPAQ